MPSSHPRPSGDHDASLPAHERAAQEVRRRRLEFGWTQDHLAERAGLSAATVRKVEAAAQTHYRDLTCTRLCAALGWPADALDAIRTGQRRPALETGQLLTTTSSPSPSTSSTQAASSSRSLSTTSGRPDARRGPRGTAPDTSSEAVDGAPSDADVAALSERIARLDGRRWERLLAFVDGLTAIDR
jgi:transcriptional regulator with XRE-family HTH domain